MSLKLLVDMNLSVEWVAELTRHGYQTVHWSSVGSPHAKDADIMDWARTNGYVVFTHDLDFGIMLALTHASGPSVLQVRGQATLPEDIGPVVLATLRQYEADLLAGALVVVDASKARVRVLPLQPCASSKQSQQP
jgi:predicted nuclease of predicted toxin-antitoxin system